MHWPEIFSRLNTRNSVRANTKATSTNGGDIINISNLVAPSRPIDSEDTKMESIEMNTTSFSGGRIHQSTWSNEEGTVKSSHV